MQTTQFNIIQTDWGIGDIICSLYAIEGLNLKYPESNITLYLRQYFEWAKIVDIPRLSVKKFYDDIKLDNAIYLYDDKIDPDKLLKHNSSPKYTFANALMVEPHIPKLKPALISGERPFGEKYIVFSPFASRINRTWEIHNWKVLATLFSNAGYKIIALDSPFESKRCRPIGVEYFWGQSPESVINFCKHAELIISNDSGLAHIGGLIGTKTLVIMSQLLPEHFYDYTSNAFVLPKHYCTGCRFNKNFGYEERCDYGCWTLQSIKPSDVFESAMQYLSS